MAAHLCKLAVDLQINMPAQEGPNTLSEEELTKAAKSDLGEDPKQLQVNKIDLYLFMLMNLSI